VIKKSQSIFYSFFTVWSKIRACRLIKLNNRRFFYHFQNHLKYHQQIMNPNSVHLNYTAYRKPPVFNPSPPPHRNQRTCIKPPGARRIAQKIQQRAIRSALWALLLIEMARGSKTPPRHHFIKWLFAGATAAFVYIFLFPSHSSTDLGDSSTTSNQALKQDNVRIAMPLSPDDPFVKIAVPLSRDDPSQTELFVLKRGDHLWNSVSEFCVRAHAAGAASPSWPWLSLQVLLHTVHDEAVKSMGPAAVANAQQAYILSLDQRKMNQVTLKLSDGRELSIASVWNEERTALRKRAAFFSELHGFKPGDPAAHVVECIMLLLSFLNVKLTDSTLQWIAVTIPKYFGMISNSSFGTRSSDRKVQCLSM
jgi:hypothetical protein